MSRSKLPEHATRATLIGWVKVLQKREKTIIDTVDKIQKLATERLAWAEARILKLEELLDKATKTKEADNADT